MALREKPRTPAEQLAFYKAHYHLRELIVRKANLLQQVNQTDIEIATYLKDIKPYTTWDELAVMLNVQSGHVVKKQFEALLGDNEPKGD